VAVLIPSIDLLGGKIVQLVQGKKKTLEFDDFEEWIVRFSKYPLVQLIDLDAAIGSGDNRKLLQQFTTRLPCQVGGGIRTIESAQEVIELGAQRIILGSVLVRNDVVDCTAAQEFADTLGSNRLTFALDSMNGRVAIKGWRQMTSITPAAMMLALESCCGAYLYTHIDTEGLLKGIPRKTVLDLRRITTRQLIVAGGIASQEEVDQLNELGIDAVVGMAIYSGRMKLDPSSA
jgi:phosphoribosylformimino-5-aminoimidazole carboxamide ribotide isomerase